MLISTILTFDRELTGVQLVDAVNKMFDRAKEAGIYDEMSMDKMCLVISLENLITVEKT